MGPATGPATGLTSGPGRRWVLNQPDAARPAGGPDRPAPVGPPTPPTVGQQGAPGPLDDTRRPDDRDDRDDRDDSPETPEAGGPAACGASAQPSTAWRRRPGRCVAWFVGVLGGLALLVAGVVEVGPAWLPGAGSVAVAGAFTWALAARTGGRPVVFGTLAVAIGVAVLVLDEDRLRTGAAALTCVVAAVLAVMGTVPARRFRHAAREGLLAFTIASIGALAVVGLRTGHQRRALRVRDARPGPARGLRSRLPPRRRLPRPGPARTADRPGRRRRCCC